jgi:membrane protein
VVLLTVPGAAVARRSLALALRHRLTGLAAEAAFFALLSLPPLLLSLLAGIGMIGRLGGDDGLIARTQVLLQRTAGSVLTPESAHAVVDPTLREVVRGGRLDVVSLGFVLALWSGSRALNVYLDTVSIMYGHGGRRGIVRTRALSFSLYLLAVVLAAAVLSVILAGLGLLADLIPPGGAGQVVSAGLGVTAGPVAVALSVVGVAGLYVIATPVPATWRHELPGALVAVTLWVAVGAVLRVVLQASVGGTSIYGPLAAPIVVLLWLYLLALAVLVGAAVNAAVDHERSALRGPAQPAVEAEPVPPAPGAEPARAATTESAMTAWPAASGWSPSAASSAVGSRLPSPLNGR